MKKSEVTILMPLIAFEELKSYKEYHEGMKNNLENLLHATSNNGVYNIHVKELINFIKSYLPYKYQNKTILINED